MDTPDVTHQSNTNLPPPDRSSGAPASPPADPASQIPPPPPSIDPNNPLASASAGGPHAATPANPATAEDSDLIEKEWVVKAKHIVDQTRSDPFKQNQEINKIKADYIKKRYNKEIKLDDT